MGIAGVGSVLFQCPIKVLLGRLDDRTTVLRMKERKKKSLITCVVWRSLGELGSVRLSLEQQCPNLRNFTPNTVLRDHPFWAHLLGWG